MCTSAAPLFFKSKDVRNLATFQDGGLWYNNPALMVRYECELLWPDRCHFLETDKGHIDYMVSLGTGSSSSGERIVMGPHSPVKTKSWFRLVESFVDHLDSELQWEKFMFGIPPKWHSRYHRFNIFFQGREPALDDVQAIERLKHQAKIAIASSSETLLTKDHMIASIFYFELDSFPQHRGGAYKCKGTILCRLPLKYGGRKKLYQWLLRSSATFIVSGRLIPCITSVPKGTPPFRQQVDFTIKSLDEQLQLSIGGITSRPTLISGMPNRLRHFIAAQGLQSPFGCSDHRMAEKPLPTVPSKRKSEDIW